MSKALQAGIPTVSMYLREIQSETFFLNFAFVKVFIAFLCFTEAATLIGTAALGKAQSGEKMQLGEVRGWSPSQMTDSS